MAWVISEENPHRKPFPLVLYSQILLTLFLFQAPSYLSISLESLAANCNMIKSPTTNAGDDIHTCGEFLRHPGKSAPNFSSPFAEFVGKGTLNNVVSHDMT